MFSLAICKAHQIIGPSELLHADAFPFPFVLAPSWLEEILRAGQGREQGESKGLFLAGSVILACTFPCGAGGGVWQCSRDGAGRAAPWCKCGAVRQVGVLQILARGRVANTLRRSLLSYSSCEVFQCSAHHRRRCQHMPNLICASHWGSGYKTYQL